MIPVSPFGLNVDRKPLNQSTSTTSSTLMACKVELVLDLFLLEDLGVTLPETNISHLKMVGWKMKLLGIAYVQVLC